MSVVDREGIIALLESTQAKGLITDEQLKVQHAFKFKDGMQIKYMPKGTQVFAHAEVEEMKWAVKELFPQNLKSEIIRFCFHFMSSRMIGSPMGLH